jgi:hypothetical protein
MHRLVVLLLASFLMWSPLASAAGRWTGSSDDDPAEEEEATPDNLNTREALILLPLDSE